MNILVIGAGLIGREIIKHHIQKGDKVYWQDNQSNPYLTYDNVVGERIGMNFDLPYFLKWNVDVVSIQASLVSVGQSTEQPEQFLNANMAVVSKVIQAVKDCGKPIKIIHSSSIGVYGEPMILPTPEIHPFYPINIYGVSKLAQEEALRVASALYNWNIISLRYFSVHGKELSLSNPHTGILNFMKRQMIETGAITINDNGQQTRDIIDVSDVASAHYAAVHTDIKGFEALNIGTGKRHTLMSIAQQMGANKIICTNVKRSGDIYHSQADINNAKRVLKWEPRVTLAQMIRAY